MIFFVSLLICVIGFVTYFGLKTFLVILIGCLSLSFILPIDVKYYLMSYFFTHLYENRNLSKKLGIKYEDDRTWITNRKETYVYLEGVFINLFSRFVGMKPILKDEVRKELMKLQSRHVNEIDMEVYFNTLDGKKLNLVEFEDFLSRSVLTETNRVFKILDKETEEELLKNVKSLKEIVDSITGDAKKGIWQMITNWKILSKISSILKSVPEHKRVLLYVPQLTLISNFTKLLVRKKGDMSGFEPYEYLEPVSTFSVFVHNGQLTFVDRHLDKNNNPSNTAFGPKGVQCPGNKFTFKFIQSIISFLQGFDIELEGQALIKGSRFAYIANKKEVFLIFKKREDKERIKIDQYEDELVEETSE